jgi:glyoxylase-like metal-dependent hydrolase (beta-lactamase superfamily II)
MGPLGLWSSSCRWYVKMTVSYPWREDPRWQELVAAAKRDRGGPEFWVYQSAHDPWLTCSYYFEWEGEVILFDTQTFQSSARELWHEIQHNTNGNLTTIVITHAHPDHCYGTGFFREIAPNARTITSRGVIEDLDRTLAPRVTFWSEVWGHEAPSSVHDIPYPDLVFDGRVTLRRGNRTLELWEVGPAEAPAQVVGWVPEERTLIVADVVQNRQTYYTADCALSEWYQILDQLERLKPEVLLTGHQGIGGPALFNETRSWIASYLGLLAGELGSERDPEDARALTNEARSRILAEMHRRFPEWYDPIMVAADDTTLSYSLLGYTTEEDGERLLKTR